MPKCVWRDGLLNASLLGLGFNHNENHGASEVGATTILSAILPQAEGVHLVMDRGVAESPFYACTDGTATCFLKLRTSDLLERFLAGKRVVLI